MSLLISSHTNRPHNSQRNARILIVNVFFDDWRRNTKSPYKIPQAMAPIYLAGTFNPSTCDVVVFNEHHSGPFRDPGLFQWADMMVLTGLTIAFDRMLHMTAYARSANPAIVVVAGGHAVRAMPNRAATVFDYACCGDVDEMLDIIEAEFSVHHAAETIVPRHDLMRHHSWMGYVESSRNCNFKCRFCTLTGEQQDYHQYSIDTLRRDILSMGWRSHVLFLDNNFYGGGSRFFHSRLELLRDLYRRNRFGGWSAMVTNDFFVREENLADVKDAGCQALFSGVESFDVGVIRQFDKKQNLVLPQLETIRRCLDAGIMFHYGMIFDLSARHIAEVRDELELLFHTPDITLPSFLSLTIPIIGTPYFAQCVKDGRIFSATKLRDLDGFTLTLKPRDPIDDAIAFTRDLPRLRGYRRKVLAKTAELLRRYHDRMTPFQLMLTTSNALLLCAPNIVNAPLQRQGKQRLRTYVSGSEPTDPLYTPRFPLGERFRDYFKPTFVTDAGGELSEAMQIDYDLYGRRLSSRDPRPELPSAVGAQEVPVRLVRGSSAG